MSRRTLALFAAVACLSVFFGAIVEMDAILVSLGVTNVFSSLSLSDTQKVNLALYLTFAVGASVIILWSAGENYRGETRKGGIVACLAFIPGLVCLILPSYFGYPYSILGVSATSFGILIMGAVAFTGLRAPRVEVSERRFLTPVDTAVIAVFSAVTAVLTGTTGAMLPSPTGGYTHIGDTAIYLSALLFGSKIGGLVGVIGPVAADLFVGYPRWFVTVLAHGSQGFISGLGKRRNIVVQVALLLLAGFVMSSIYFLINVYIKGFPLAFISFIRDFFGQSLVSIIFSLVLTKGVEKALPNLRR